MTVGSPSRKKAALSASLGMAVLLLVLGCQAEPESSPPSAPQSSQSDQGTGGDEPEGSIVPAVLPPNTTAKGVVLATVIIATGNVASAIEQGLISPQEVDLAREAISKGATQDWVDAAEAE